MQVEWYGQSAFRLWAKDGTTVFIDPFGDMSSLADRGIAWEYPPIADVNADVLLVTHEHRDHNAVEQVGGGPAIVRSTAGRHHTAALEVIGVASGHDAAAGTERGPNTIYVFELDGMRIAHFGDFGQSELRPAQAAAIGTPDLLFIPAGGGPTIAAVQAAAIAGEIGARWIVPMHYRTERIGFLERADDLLRAYDSVATPNSTFDTDELGDAPRVVAPTAP